MADAAEHGAGRGRLGDLVGQHLRGAEVERRAPAAGQEDDVVVGHVQVADGQGIGDLGPQEGVAEEAVVLGAADDRLEGHRVDRDDPTGGAGHVHLEAGVQEPVVGHGHLRGEDPGRLAHVEDAVVGGDHEGPATGQVEGRGVGVLGVHAEALHDPAQELGGLGWGHGLDAGVGATSQVRPGLVAFRHRRGPFLLQPRAEQGEHLVRRRVVRPVDRFDRVGLEVVQLPLVREGLGPVGRASEALGGQVADLGLGPGGRVVEGAHQLPPVPAAARGVDVGHPADQPLEVRPDVGRDLDAQGCRGMCGPPETAGHSGRPAVTLQHVVPGHEVDGPVRVGGGAVDHRQQVDAG